MTVSLKGKPAINCDFPAKHPNNVTVRDLKAAVQAKFPKVSPIVWQYGMDKLTYMCRWCPTVSASPSHLLLAMRSRWLWSMSKSLWPTMVYLKVPSSASRISAHRSPTGGCISGNT